MCRLVTRVGVTYQKQVLEDKDIRVDDGYHLVTTVEKVLRPEYNVYAKFRRIVPLIHWGVQGQQAAS